MVFFLCPAGTDIRCLNAERASGNLTVKNSGELLHRIDGHAIFGKCDNLIPYLMKIRFDLPLLRLANRSDSVERQRCERAPGILKRLPTRQCNRKEAKQEKGNLKFCFEAHGVDVFNGRP